jgi:hypothetical protein
MTTVTILTTTMAYLQFFRYFNVSAFLEKSQQQRHQFFLDVLHQRRLQRVMVHELQQLRSHQAPVPRRQGSAQVQDGKEDEAAHLLLRLQEDVNLVLQHTNLTHT